MLKLKEGFVVVEWEGCEYITPKGAGIEGAFASVIRGDAVNAFPNGGGGYKRVASIEEAHEYLLSVGSGSPWEEVSGEVAVEAPAPDTLTRLIAAAQNVEFSLAGLTVTVDCNSAGEYYAEIESLQGACTRAHTTPNAALEALLDCKVGAVTVAQILGVA